MKYGVSNVGISAKKLVENYFNDNLEELVITDAITTIGYASFYARKKLKNITIPSSVTSIGAYAFFNCHNLTSITLPSGVTSIGDYAFYNCYRINRFTFGGTVSQWNNITKGTEWAYRLGVSEIICRDGSVAI